MSLRFLLTAAVVLTVLGATCAEGVQKCYYCSSEDHTSCLDPYDKTLGIELECKTLEDYASRSASSRSKAFNRAFEQEQAKSLTAGGGNITYKCVKAFTSTADQKNTLTRICAPYSKFAPSACGVLKELIAEGTTMGICYECDKDMCNGSPAILSAAFTLLAAACFALLF